MSLHFLLDGYNIIKQTPNLNHGTLESQRLGLLSWINRDKPQGSINNSVTIIFDGKEEFFGSHASGAIKVVFSKGQSADDLIKKIVEQYPLKKSLVIISDDKDIKLYVRALGAGILSVKEFTKGLLKRSKQASTKTSQEISGKYISLTQQDKINKEMERIWIKSK
jgi:predicted RNA-binding protein with PIN domain